VFRRNGAITRGNAATLSLSWYQTLCLAMAADAGSGMGKRSAKPRTPFKVPK
jgi:hypothetical protein